MCMIHFHREIKFCLMVYKHCKISLKISWRYGMEHRIVPAFFTDFVGICEKRTVVLRVRVSVKSTNVASDCLKFSFVKFELLMYCVDEKYGSEFLLSNRYINSGYDIMNAFFFNQIYHIMLVILDTEVFSTFTCYFSIKFIVLLL